jgi:hypothetical protein
MRKDHAHLPNRRWREERERSEKFDLIDEYQISRCGRIAINCPVD